MSTVPKPPDLAPGQTALAAHVTPLYDFLNGRNLDDGNLRDNGVDAAVLRDATLNLAAKLMAGTWPVNAIPATAIVAATTGSVTLGFGQSSTVTHNKGRFPILGVSASAAGDGVSASHVMACTAQTANSFTIGPSGANLATAPAVSATVFYSYF